ncbi:Uncharacterised protein [Shigella sonnei]|nr:Uncharacterised protein [Shigella sonnei]CSQ17841.1 Uncharacterised protein [Shigella sonnei]
MMANTVLYGTGYGENIFSQVKAPAHHKARATVDNKGHFRCEWPPVNRVRAFQLHAVTVTNPDIIHRHSGPVAARESLKLTVFTASYPAFLFHHFRQFLHCAANGVIRGHDIEHIRLISVPVLPFSNKILVSLGHWSAV